eukprot:s30_g23.t1
MTGQEEKALTPTNRSDVLAAVLEIISRREAKLTPQQVAYAAYSVAALQGLNRSEAALAAVEVSTLDEEENLAPLAEVLFFQGMDLAEAKTLVVDTAWRLPRVSAKALRQAFWHFQQLQDSSRQLVRSRIMDDFEGRPAFSAYRDAQAFQGLQVATALSISAGAEAQQLLSYHMASGYSYKQALKLLGPEVNITEELTLAGQRLTDQLALPTVQSVDSSWFQSAGSRPCEYVVQMRTAKQWTMTMQALSPSYPQCISEQFKPTLDIWHPASIIGNLSFQLFQPFQPAMVEAKAELRDFLRHRCGNLKAAFAALDSSETGQLSRHDFETSLQRLGYDANCAAAAFRDLDRQNAGVVNLRTFVNGLMSDAVPNFELQKPARHTYHPGMSTPRKLSDTALAPTLLQRLAPAPIAPITLAAPLTPKKGAERCPTTLGPRGPTQASSASPRNHPLSERLRQLELQLASEQEARCNLEWRLTSQFREMIREEFQALRKQLAEDAVQQPGRFGLYMDINRRAKEAEDHEERRYVMMPSVSERRLDDTAPATGVPPSAASSGPTEELSKLQLTPRTSLRQENLSLREQILTLREQAIEAKEREAAAAGLQMPKYFKPMRQSKTCSPSARKLQNESWKPAWELDIAHGIKVHGKHGRGHPTAQ